ncbi:adenosine deaminase family protein [bacterium]|nr:adenosine deaminase family protein [bacterium]
MNKQKPIDDPAFIQALPKSDLHVHMDGSIRLATLIELAQRQKVRLPAYSEEGLKELVFKERYTDLGEYLEGFKYIVPVLQDEESLERVAYELAWDNIGEKVYYLEMRFAPQLHINHNLNMLQILSSVCRGLERASKEFNRSVQKKKEHEPDFHYGIIVCAMRMFDHSFSHYYQQFSQMLQFTEFKQQTGLASLELARAAVYLRDKYGLPIVGFDLAGQENGYPALDHKLAFHYAHQNFLKSTVHAGEAYGPESIYQAITELYADRLGHAYHLFSEDLLNDPKITDKKRYVESLTEYIADRRITIEVCLTSNLQTLPDLHAMDEHSFHKMLKYGLSTTLCTDNRTVSNTSVTKEILLALRTFNINARQLKNMVIYGFKRSFFPGSYQDKRRYVRQVIDYYENIETRYHYVQTDSELQDDQ